MPTSMRRTEMSMKIGNRIREFREAKGMERKQMAKEMQLSIIRIYQYENGHNVPHLRTMIAICRVLGISMDQFFTREFIEEIA